MTSRAVEKAMKKDRDACERNGPMNQTGSEEDDNSSLVKVTPMKFMQELASDVTRCFRVPDAFLVDDKYEVLRRIGSGAFGNVYKVRNVKEDAVYAMKVIKSRHVISPGVLREIEVLFHLGKSDPEQKRFIVKIVDALSFHRHICILYEFLGPTVFTILCLNHRKGFPMNYVRDITRQIASAADFLHLNGIIHHDIKPDNIAFACREFEEDSKGNKIIKRTDVRLIDFGSSVYANKGNCSTATTRQYRSPEMGLRFMSTYTSDVWSIGCSVFELYNGHLLFPCTSEAEKCYMMEAVCEQPIPFEMGRTSGLTCFTEKGMLKYQSVPGAVAIQERVKPLMDYQINPEDPDTRNFFDLLKRMLKINPRSRISAGDILKHPFFAVENPISK